MNAEDIEKVSVIGSGSMGHGIAEVIAIAGYDVSMYDIEEDILEDAMENVEGSLAKLQEKDIISEEDVDATLERISTSTDLEEVAKGVTRWDLSNSLI